MHQIGLVEIAGIVVFLALVAWPIVFFRAVRPRIMDRIGRWLGADVHESTDAWDAGLYDTRQGTPLAKTAGLIALDFIVILVGVVGVIGAVAVPLFPFVESAVPFRWEGQLTGTAVRIGDVVVPPMHDRKATARVTVSSHAREPVRECRLDVADYAAKNGYLNGARATCSISNPHPAPRSISPVRAEARTGHARVPDQPRMRDADEGQRPYERRRPVVSLHSVIDNAPQGERYRPTFSRNPSFRSSTKTVASVRRYSFSVRTVARIT